MEQFSVATIINYCSNDRAFITDCIAKISSFSKKIIIPVCDHFFDGKAENMKELYNTFKKFPHCDFIFYPYIPHKIDEKLLSKVGDKRFWHCLSRLLSFAHVPSSIDYILFLDVDEIVDDKAFTKWISSGDVNKYDAMKLSCYWYFRHIWCRATTWEDTPVIIRRKAVTHHMLLHKDERDAIYDGVKDKNNRNTLSVDGVPMIHHYSWVRTKKQMLRKVVSWGHCHDRDWESLIEKEFSKEFSGMDFVHGYKFEKVDPYVTCEDIEMTQEEGDISTLSHVDILSSDRVMKEINRYKKKKFFNALRHLITRK
jgi:hypothetical protein